MKRIIVLGLLVSLAAGLAMGLIGCVIPNEPPPAPTYGTVKFDNYTSYTINCYIDGNFQGSMGAWGARYVTNVPTGGHTLYATSGGVHWGPRDITLDKDETWIWKLYP